MIQNEEQMLMTKATINKSVNFKQDWLFSRRYSNRLLGKF